MSRLNNCTCWSWIKFVPSWLKGALGLLVVLSRFYFVCCWSGTWSLFFLQIAGRDSLPDGCGSSHSAEKEGMENIVHELPTSSIWRRASSPIPTSPSQVRFELFLRPVDHLMLPRWQDQHTTTAKAADLPTVGTAWILSRLNNCTCGSWIKLNKSVFQVD